MRSVIPLNNDWEFSITRREGEWKTVVLPHTNVQLPHHNFNPNSYAFRSYYRKALQLPEPLDGRRLFIDFEGAMIASIFSINGHTFPEHRGGYVPFSFEITDHVKEGGQNLLEVSVDSSERPDIPPFGNVVDYLTFGGIYREVQLRYVPKVSISDVSFRVLSPLGAPQELLVRVELENVTARTEAVEILVEIGESSSKLKVEVAEKETVEITLRPEVPLALWGISTAILHNLIVTAHSVYGEDVQRTRVGVRHAKFEKDGFYLNGEKLKLRGLNRHQTFPYIGAAAPARLQRKDAEILKWELGCTIVRTSHYPQSRHFLDRCDELGLLVLEEIPGWQHIGDREWQELSLRDVRSMISRDKNHPSIVLWGVRINESPDEHAFYVESNRIARELDPTRQTGGIRNFQGSEFLEDVFTYNDFSNSIEKPLNAPHLVTEFNGHMYPTKTFDNEERLIEHALRHARIQDKAYQMEDVSGAIGWCAFDYNTHRDFGSGDMICYHGVMDIFRLPKYAGYFYESQQGPSERVVLQVASGWTMGDRSEGGNDPLVVFSNCESIRVFIGDRKIGDYLPDRENYSGLPYPPFVVPGLTMIATWGALYQDLVVQGLIGGEVVIERKIAAAAPPAGLTLECDDRELLSDGSDMTRVIFRIVDRYGTPLRYAFTVVDLSLHFNSSSNGTPPALIGDLPMALVGGQAAVYLKSGTATGHATITARGGGFEVSTAVTFGEIA